MSVDCGCEKKFPLCCKQAYDFVLDSHVLVADDCDKLKSQFGRSIAMSCDGRILVVGAPLLTVNDIDNTGAIYIYERQRSIGATVKTPDYKLLQKIVGAPAGSFPPVFGYKVAISGNGQRIVASAVNAKNTSLVPEPVSGIVYVFDYTCSNGKGYYKLVQQVYAQQIVADEIIYDNPGPNAANFGNALALSFDGRVLAVEISPTNIPFGKIYIYEDSSCNVLRVGCCVKPEAEPVFVFRQNMDRARLLSDSGLVTVNGVADSVALDNHGDVVVIGCKEVQSAEGRILVYKRVPDTFTWVFDQTLSSPSPAGGEHFGVSVDITADGTRVVGEAGGNTVNPPRGYGVVFYRFPTDTQYTTESVLPSAAPDFNFLNAFDVQIAISDNGCIVAIGYEGTPFNSQNNCGDVVIYERKCQENENDDGNIVSTWQSRQRLFEPTSRPEHRFGNAVALDSKGLILAVASPAPQPTDLVGKVYTYRAPTTC